MLQLDDVSRILPGAPARVLFERLALRVKAGECVAIVGESGSGKSTAGLSLVKLLPPEADYVSGEVLFEGRDQVRL